MQDFGKKSIFVSHLLSRLRDKSREILILVLQETQERKTPTKNNLKKEFQQFFQVFLSTQSKRKLIEKSSRKRPGVYTENPAEEKPGHP